MGLQDVRQRWGTYTSLVQAMFTGINDPQKLGNASAVIGEFPAANPREWGDWVNAYGFLASLDNAVSVTDVALRQENAFIVAANELAAKVKLPAPTRVDVTSVVEQLGVVNKRIRQDQRFHAALAIGLAVAGEVEQ
jgi:hypothetical protein